MPSIRRKSTETKIRERLAQFAEDYSLTDDVVGKIVEAYFDAEEFGIHSDAHRAQLLRAKIDLKAARDKLAAFEEAWQVALGNDYVLNHLLDAYIEYLPTESRDELIAKWIAALDRMNSFSGDVARIKGALDSVAQRDSLTLQHLPSQLIGRRLDAKTPHVVKVLANIAEQLQGLDSPEKRNEFVTGGMEALEFRQSRKTIKNLRASRRVK